MFSVGRSIKPINRESRAAPRDASTQTSTAGGRSLGSALCSSPITDVLQKNAGKIINTSEKFHSHDTGFFSADILCEGFNMMMIIWYIWAENSVWNDEEHSLHHVVWLQLPLFAYSSQ